MLGPSCSRLGFQSTSKLLWHPWPIYTTGRTFTFVTKFNWSQKKPWLIKNQPNNPGGNGLLILSA